MSLFHLWTRREQLARLSDMMTLLAKMHDELRGHRNWARLGIDQSTMLAELDEFIVRVAEAQNALRRGASPIIFRHNIIKAERRVMFAADTFFGRIAGADAFTARFGSGE